MYVVVYLVYINLPNALLICTIEKDAVMLSMYVLIIYIIIYYYIIILLYSILL